jgi:hypothetical protein
LDIHPDGESQVEQGIMQIQAINDDLKTQLEEIVTQMEGQL